MKADVAKRYNRRIYPIYKGMGWDPLFYGAIIFLFLTQVKGLSPSTIMYAEAAHTVFVLLFKIPAAILIEKLGSRKALILGNTLVTIQIAMMMFANNFMYLVIAYFFSGLGYSITAIARNTLLYDSTKECKGKNSFANIDAKGSSVSYIFNAFSSVVTGFLFAINAYVPLILSSFVSFMTVIIAYRFEEVGKDKKQKVTISQSVRNIKQGFVFIAKSKRLRALFLFSAFFTGVLMMFGTYEKGLLKDLQVSPQYFGIIFGCLTLIQCFSAQYQDKIHKVFKSRALTLISVPIFILIVVIGAIVTLKFNYIITIMIVIIGFGIHHFLRGPYWVLQSKYLTNFTNSNIRAKILATNGLVEGIGRTIMMFVGGFLLDNYTTSESYLILGISGLVIILVILRYMKTRIGLRPEKYDKKDIELEN